MSKWKVEYWDSETGKNPVEKWLDGLTREQFQSIFKEIVMLKIAGNELKLPHSRALGKGLFELRERKYGYRIYYGFLEKFIIILLAAGNKKSQEKDILVARKRLSKY